MTQSGEWKNNPLPGTAAPGSALTCFGIDGTATRLYYLDANHVINELAWVHNGWKNNLLRAKAAAGSDLTCYGADGAHTRLYFVGPDNRVHELAWQDSAWKNPTVMPGLPMAGTKLTCFEGTTTLPTVLLFTGRDGEINNVSYSDVIKGYDCVILPFSTASGSALTCVGTKGGQPRLYYLDTSQKLTELAYWADNPSWDWSSGPDRASGFDARPRRPARRPGPP